MLSFNPHAACAASSDLSLPIAKMATADLLNPCEKFPMIHFPKSFTFSSDLVLGLSTNDQIFPDLIFLNLLIRAEQKDIEKITAQLEQIKNKVFSSCYSYKLMDLLKEKISNLKLPVDRKLYLKGHKGVALNPLDLDGIYLAMKKVLIKNFETEYFFEEIIKKNKKTVDIGDLFFQEFIPFESTGDVYINDETYLIYSRLGYKGLLGVDTVEDECLISKRTFFSYVQRCGIKHTQIYPQLCGKFKADDFSDKKIYFPSLDDTSIKILSSKIEMLESELPLKKVKFGFEPSGNLYILDFSVHSEPKVKESPKEKVFETKEFPEDKRFIQIDGLEYIQLSPVSLTPFLLELNYRLIESIRRATNWSHLDGVLHIFDGHYAIKLNKQQYYKPFDEFKFKEFKKILGEFEKHLIDMTLWSLESDLTAKSFQNFVTLYTKFKLVRFLANGLKFSVEKNVAKMASDLKISKKIFDEAVFTKIQDESLIETAIDDRLQEQEEWPRLIDCKSFSELEGVSPALAQLIKNLGNQYSFEETIDFEQEANLEIVFQDLKKRCLVLLNRPIDPVQKYASVDFFKQSRSFSDWLDLYVKSLVIMTESHHLESKIRHKIKSKLDQIDPIWDEFSILKIKAMLP